MDRMIRSIKFFLLVEISSQCSGIGKRKPHFFCRFHDDSFRAFRRRRNPVSMQNNFPADGRALCWLSGKYVFLQIFHLYQPQHIQGGYKYPYFVGANGDPLEEAENVKALSGENNTR